MLIQPNKAALGDGILSPQEGVVKLREECTGMTDKCKIPGQKELEDHERSAGPRMSSASLIRRLQSLNPGLRVKDGSVGNVALYILRRPDEMEEERVHSDPFFDDHKYVGGFPLEPLPEYSHVTLDNRGLPLREIRGWRTVLMFLIKARVITYQGAVAEFGEACGPRSHRWHEQMAGYKY